MTVALTARMLRALESWRTNEEAAEDLGVTAGLLSHFRTGIREPTEELVERAEQLAKARNPVGVILGDADPNDVLSAYDPAIAILERMATSGDDSERLGPTLALGVMKMRRSGVRARDVASDSALAERVVNMVTKTKKEGDSLTDLVREALAGVTSAEHKRIGAGSVTDAEVVDDG